MNPGNGRSIRTSDATTGTAMRKDRSIDRSIDLHRDSFMIRSLLSTVYCLLFLLSRHQQQQQQQCNHHHHHHPSAWNETKVALQQCPARALLSDAAAEDRPSKAEERQQLLLLLLQRNRKLRVRQHAVAPRHSASERPSRPPRQPRGMRASTNPRPFCCVPPNRLLRLLSLLSLLRQVATTTTTTAAAVITAFPYRTRPRRIAAPRVAQRATRNWPTTPFSCATARTAVANFTGSAACPPCPPFRDPANPGTAAIALAKGPRQLWNCTLGRRTRPGRIAQPPGRTARASGNATGKNCKHPAATTQSRNALVPNWTGPCRPTAWPCRRCGTAPAVRRPPTNETARRYQDTKRAAKSRITWPCPTRCGPGNRGRIF